MVRSNSILSINVYINNVYKINFGPFFDLYLIPTIVEHEVFNRFDFASYNNDAHKFRSSNSNNVTYMLHV